MLWIAENLALARVPRWLLLGSVLLGLGLYSALLGIVAASGNILILLALVGLPLGIVGLSFATRYFESLVLALPFTAVFFRFVQLPTGSGSVVPLSLAISLTLLGIWLASMFVRRRWQVPHTAFNTPLFAFMAVCLISWPWGALWRDPILDMHIMGNFQVTQIGSLVTLLVSMAVPFLVGRFIDQPWKIWLYLGAFILGGALMTGTQFLGITHNFFNDRGLWGLWFCAPVFGLLIAQPGLHWRWRPACIVLIGWNLYQTVIVNSLWISGWLPSVLGMLGVLFFRSRQVFAIVVLIAALGLAVGPGRSFIDEVTQENVAEGGLERLGLWEQNWFVVSNHWLFGTGPAGYAAYNMTYFRFDARSTHNNYLDILAQFGFTGMFFWLWFTGATLWVAWRTVHEAPPGLLRTTAMIAGGGWIGGYGAMMLGDWILPFAYNQGIGGFGYTVYSWIFLGLLIAVREIQARSATAPAPVEQP